MEIVCLDLEGVLVPEVWIRVARKTKIEALKLTTRDIRDYDELMQYRLKILRRHKIKLKDIQKVIATIRPLPGAKRFLDQLRAKSQVVILSDTFYEFAEPLMKQLGYPTLLCHYLSIDKKGFVKSYQLRQKNSKEKAVRAFRKLNFKVSAAGDSYNDLTMLKSAHQGILFNPPLGISKEYTQYPVAKSYGSLLRMLLA